MTNLSVFAGEFEGNGIRVTEDGRFSVFDVLVAFGVADKKSNAKNTLERISSKYSEVTAFCSNFKFPGRGQRETPVANEEGIYQILMLCPGKRGAEFRSWAAKIVRERREEESNPELAYSRGRDRAIRAWKKQGKTDAEISNQLKSIDTRNEYTDILKDHGVILSWQYAAITNIPYEALTGCNAKQLKAQMGIAKNQRLKDHLPNDVLIGQMAIETRSGDVIKRDDVQGFKECRDTTKRIADAYQRFLNET